MVTGAVRFNDLLMAMAGGESKRYDAVSGERTGADKPLSGAAKRALAEAAARREEQLRREASMPKEIGGRGGLDPGRYGDWEVKGLGSDF